LKDGYIKFVRSQSVLLAAPQLDFLWSGKVFDVVSDIHLVTLKLLHHLVLRKFRYIVPRGKNGILFLLHVSADHSPVSILIVGGPLEYLICGVFENGFVAGPAVLDHGIDGVLIGVEDSRGLQELRSLQLGHGY